MSAELPRRTSRRAVLGLGLAVAAATTGCSADDDASLAPPAGADPRVDPDPSTGSGGSGGSVDLDTDRVRLLVTEISRAHARVRANRRAHRPLAEALLGLERLHARHAAELGGLVAVAASTVPAERRQDQVRGRLIAVEARLQRRLVDDAVAAESGALALVVASMAAGLAQETSLL